ncbi:hypothetical protein [Clostridium peptidivorans]|uniref:hypothetical protein n=1 Tax=Clostridium peptidivorans TaxID=100174 RepID=UPI000BE38B55|nr:hypothetical protein [Clostridium peptidivorans]
MINKLIYIFKRDLILYVIVFIMLSSNALIPGLMGGLIGALIGGLLGKRYGKFNIFLSFQTSRKEYYVIAVIYNLLSSAIISLVLALVKVNSNNIPKNYFKYVFLFYFTLVLVFLSAKLFNEFFKHSDYAAVRFGVIVMYLALFVARYGFLLFNDNFINFNENLFSYQEFKLMDYYIMSFLIIGFNYVTSYLVNRSTEIQINGEAE